MILCVVPTVSFAESESYIIKKEYDAKTGCTTITTDDYVAVVPEGGLVIYDSDKSNTYAEQIIETKEYSYKDYIVPFDYDSTVNMAYQHLSSTYPDMDLNSAMENAQQLAKNMEVANEFLTNGDMKDINSVATKTESGALVFDLGCIRDGKLVSSGQKTYVPDSRTTIVSEGWKTNPHLEKEQRLVDILLDGMA